LCGVNNAGFRVGKKRLADYFELQKDRPFVWGENDCILFSANAVSLLLDRDIIGEISEYGTYDRELALEILSRHGGQISGILDKHFKRKPQRPESEARRYSAG
jgi:hypothetical protein